MPEEIHLESPVPLYRQMCDILRREIETQGLAAGTRLPTEKELAKRFGVSMITVRGCVGEMVKEGLLVRRQGRGTFVASRKPKATQIVMAIVPDVTDYGCARLLVGIQSVTAQYGYELITGNSRDHAQTERNLLDRAFARNVEGLIVVTGRGAFANGYLVGNRLYIPLVVVDSYHPSVEADFFYTNDVIGSHEATRHLIEAGYRRIGHLMGPKGHFLAELRLHGYRRAMREAGITVEANWIVEAGTSAEAGHKALMALLRQDLTIDAVFAYNDMVALGAMRALSEIGRRVPQDFGVAGYGNHIVAAYAQPSLTTVDSDPEGLGRRVGQRLLARIRDEVRGGEFVKEILPVRLVVGKSARSTG
jgi:LacI family transcriptional regulator